ncbi:MAG: hypothetical protein ACKOPQ_04160 [Novosphingobium sp.]|jgi:hypothetical protein
MKKIAFAALAPFAVLALAGCAKTDDPNAEASADNVEMPAEEAVNAAEASAAPVADKAAAEPAASEAAAEGPKTPDKVKEDAAATAKEFEDLGKDEEPKQ